MQRREIGQRKYLFAAPNSQYCASNQEERQVAAHLCRYAQFVLRESWIPSACSIASMAATAFDDAAPIPPCTGSCFSIVMTILPAEPLVFINRSAIL